MNTRLLIFDLDGTLIDSERDLADSVNATLAAEHLPPLPLETIASYIGNGAPVLIRRAFPDAADSELPRLLRYFLDYYREHMLDSTKLYPGVREALDRLHAANVAMAVLTNKPVRFSVSLIAGLGLESHFFRVYGGNSFEHKKPNPLGINRLRSETGADASETIMVGDSSVDIQTARNAGVKACGVIWGFRPETFAQFPPDFVIDQMGALADLVISS
ncbi:MAG TPA: HAD-IA family hydrolase [Bryobacteraceae bacterium]|nr:HAD-IA family hydrolase [Bryobacteraceae bacterium]